MKVRIGEIGVSKSIDGLGKFFVNQVPFLALYYYVSFICWR